METLLLKVKSYIHKSPLHGIGLFSSEYIRKGQVVGELNKFDLLIHKDEISDDDIWFFDFYCSLNGDYYQTYADNMRFMNHSKTPNCIDTPDGKTIALRDIPIGQELTCDYSLI